MTTAADPVCPGPWFSWHALDWVGETQGMPPEAKGAYVDLLSHSWRNGMLPNDPAILRRITGATARQWRRIWSFLSRKFREVPVTEPLPGEVMVGLVNDRLEAERAKVRRKSRQASDAASSRWGAGDTGTGHEAADAGERADALERDAGEDASARADEDALAHAAEDATEPAQGHAGEDPGEDAQAPAEDDAKRDAGGHARSEIRGDLKKNARDPFGETEVLRAWQQVFDGVRPSEGIADLTEELIAIARDPAALGPTKIRSPAELPLAAIRAFQRIRQHADPGFVPEPEPRSMIRKLGAVQEVLRGQNPEKARQARMGPVKAGTGGRKASEDSRPRPPPVEEVLVNYPRPEEVCGPPEGWHAMVAGIGIEKPIRRAAAAASP
jgi:uncharacterized protein YdaU (DUF1376 family)